MLKSAMYREDAERQPHDFHRAQVDLIVEAVRAAGSLTVFAPSGFGKSTALKYITYNRRYRHRHRWMRSFSFVYIDCRDIATIVDDYMRRAGTDLHTQTLSSLLEEKLLESFKRTSPSAATDLYEELSRLVKRNLNYYLILDSFETLIGPEYREALQFMRVLRDKYKPYLEYVFAVSDLGLATNISRNTIGPIADLMAERVVYVPLGVSARDVDLQSVIGLSSWRRMLYRFKQGRRAYYKWVDSLSGGYPQYSRFLNQLARENQKPPSLTAILDRPEIKAATDRLLGSLTKPCIEGLAIVAIHRPPTLKGIHFADILTKLGLVVLRGGVYEVFSPILRTHLLRMYGSEV